MKNYPLKARSLSSADFRVRSFVCATLNESREQDVNVGFGDVEGVPCVDERAPPTRAQRHSTVDAVFVLSLASIFWHTGNRSETSNITNWIQVRAELTPAVAVHVQLLAFQFTPNAFAFNLISLRCMKSKSPIQDIMISFVGFDERSKPVIGALPLNRVSNATRRIGNLMSLGTFSMLAQHSMIFRSVTVARDRSSSAYIPRL